MSRTMPQVTVPITYQREWQDGFGDRGWKLDATLDEPNVIAATAATGENIPTSVLIHDLLDHHLSGFAVGGHRNVIARPWRSNRHDSYRVSRSAAGAVPHGRYDPFMNNDNPFQPKRRPWPS